MTDNERETAVTAEIKRHLREMHPIVTSIDASPVANSAKALQTLQSHSKGSE